MAIENHKIRNWFRRRRIPVFVDFGATPGEDDADNLLSPRTGSTSSCGIPTENAQMTTLQASHPAYSRGPRMSNLHFFDV